MLRQRLVYRGRREVVGGNRVLVVGEDPTEQSRGMLSASVGQDVADVGGFVGVFVLGCALVDIGGVSQPRVMAT